MGRQDGDAALGSERGALVPFLPLQGVRVVLVGGNVPGPVATARLRELGAQVTKVEGPGGDPLAHMCRSWYDELCAGVEVRQLDLKASAGLTALAVLLGDADVLITSFRPSTLARLGLDASATQALHPQLCQVMIVGSTDDGGEHAGHDLTYQASAGLLAPPVNPTTLIADLAGAERVVSAVLALLFARRSADDRAPVVRTVTVSLSDSAAQFAAPLRHGLTGDGGLLGAGNPCYRQYRAADGWIAVAAIEQHFRDRMLRALGVMDTADAATLAATLTEIFSVRTVDAWRRFAHEHDVPIDVVR